MSGFQVGLRSLLRRGLSEPGFYGDLVYRLKKIVGSNGFQCDLLKWFSIIKGLAVAIMYCNRLHAWWSARSRLVTLLFSLAARRWVRLRALWWF